MYKRKSYEPDLPFDQLIETMKIEALVKRISDVDKEHKITYEVARKLAPSLYKRQKNIKSYRELEKELINVTMVAYGKEKPPQIVNHCLKVLYKFYYHDAPFMRLVACNAFNSFLDQFIQSSIHLETTMLKSYFYRLMLVSIYLSSQSLEITDNIYYICAWTYAVIGRKTDKEIRTEVESFIKHPIPPSDGVLKDAVISIYESDVSGTDILRMIRYSSIYKAAAHGTNKADFIVPNDIIALVQEYKETQEKLKDRMRFYYDKSDNTRKAIENFLNMNKVKL